MRSGGSENNGAVKVSIDNQALGYMEKKYGEPFQYVSPSGDSLSGTHALIVSCESLPGAEILVEVQNFRSEENRVFTDNYLAFKYEDQTREFLRNCASDVFGDVEVFYNVTEAGLSPDLPADADFAQYLADSKAPLQAWIEVKGNGFSSKNQMQVFSDLISEKNSHYYFTVMVVQDGEFGLLDRDALSRKWVDQTFVCCAEINNSGATAVIDWIGEEPSA